MSDEFGDMDPDLPLRLTLEVDEYLLGILYVSLENQLKMMPENCATSVAVGAMTREEAEIGIVFGTLAINTLKEQISDQFPGVVAKTDQMSTRITRGREKAIKEMLKKQRRGK